MASYDSLFKEPMSGTLYSRVLDYTFMANNPAAYDSDADMRYNTEDEVALHTENLSTDMDSETDAENHVARQRKEDEDDPVLARIRASHPGPSYEADEANYIRRNKLPLNAVRDVRNKKPPHHVYVMFKRVAGKGVGEATSLNEYLVNNVQPCIMRNQFTHVELYFREHMSSFVSAMNLDGVTFIKGKKFLPDEYTDVFEIVLSEGKYGMSWDYAEKIIAGKDYDTIFYYCYCFIACGIPCDWKSRTETFTCAAAVAKLLPIIGIGSNEMRASMANNKNITPDQVYDIMYSVYSGDIPMSKRINSINLIHKLPDDMIL